MITVKCDKQLSSIEIIYSFIEHYESLERINFIEQTSLVIKKMNYHDFCDVLKDSGKITSAFITYGNSKGMLKSGRIYSLQSLRDYIIMKDKTSKDETDKILKYLLSIYIHSKDDLRKELFFTLWNKNRTKIDDYLTTNLCLLSSKVYSYILYKDSITEDGSVPKKKTKPVESLLETVEYNPLKKINYSDIILDKEKQERLTVLFEDQINILDDKDTVELLINIAREIGLNIILD